MLSEFQRWLIRSSARNMRKEIGGQVRKTFSGGRTESANVWDVATTEIPAEVGEAPECQWCPICRAARQLRESGPGIGGHISGAGNAVASAVQDAINAFDTVLSKAAGTSDRDRHDRLRPDLSPDTRPGPDAPVAATRAADVSRTAERPAPPVDVTPAPIVAPGAGSPETAEAAAGKSRREPDTWSLATDVPADETGAAGADANPGAEARDGGHEPDDRS
jgi:hypothetical protein